jgi:extracellular factor (EF) 3-hydroxypalmitic acid methyl ester biosynthesis protein
MELEGAGLDLSAVYRLGARRSAADRWAGAHAAALRPDIAPALRAWVASLRGYLESVDAFLRGEEAALAGEDLATRRAVEGELLDLVGPDVASRVDSAWRELGPVVGHLAEEEHAAHRAFCQAQLGPLFFRSPFLRRAREKPLGYAGDYEMMNMLYRDHAEGPDLFARVMNLCGTRQAAARANVNRIAYLGGRIEAAARDCRRERLRVASIGCGPGQEIRELLSRRPELGPRLDVALIDQEERAIAHCERSLSPVARATGARLRVIPESVRRLLGGRGLADALGERDLVYSAGLFDYLSDRAFEALLGSLYAGLAPGGALLVGNVAADNPSRWAMEYLCEWFLVHRSPAELRERARGLAPAPASLEVDSEPLGVNLFLVARR